jgi:hypothetical protein
MTKPRTAPDLTGLEGLLSLLVETSRRLDEEEATAPPPNQVSA